MEVFVVGGALRDRMLKVDSKDTDYVVVGSTPQEMLDAGFKQVGADFPVFLDPDGNEFALARTERKSGKGYMGFVTVFDPSVSLVDDLKRRDLTINAMALAVKGVSAVVDPFGGREDIENKVLRHVSEAFGDDPVRVLRLARFHARFGPEWRVDEGTLALCRKMVAEGELEHLTRERVLKEFERALGEKHPALFFQTLHDVGALEVVFPELAAMGIENVTNALTLLAPHSTMPAFVYSKLSIKLSIHCLLEAFESRHNVSGEFKAFGNMLRPVMQRSTDHPVDRLYEMDAFRKADLFVHVCHEAVKAGVNMARVATLTGAFAVARDIGFDDIPEEIRDALKGPAIAVRIREMRKEAADH